MIRYKLRMKQKAATQAHGGFFTGSGHRPRIQNRLFVGNGSRRRLIHFELGAHLLDLRGLLFKLSRQLRDSGFQFLNFAIEHGLLGGVGNGLWLDALGRKSTRIGCINRERAQRNAYLRT